MKENREAEIHASHSAMVQGRDAIFSILVVFSVYLVIL